MKHVQIIAFLLFCFSFSTFAQEKLIEESKEKISDVAEDVEEFIDEKKEQIEENKEEKEEMKEEKKEAKEEEKEEKKEAKEEEKEAEKEMKKLTPKDAPAPETIDVEETQTTMSRGENNALYIEIKDAETKEVEKHWKKYIKSEYAGKKTETDRSDEMVTENASIAGLGSNVTVYAKAMSLSNGATGFTAWFENVDGFVSSDNETAYKVVEGLMYDFGIEERKYAVNEQLEDAEKEQKSLEKDLGSLESKNKNLHDDIESYRKKIKQAEEDIATNLKDQETKKVEIEAQKNAVSKVLDLYNSIR